jgi:dTDP-4-amino-4,6-dideoxygalactose transaminase
MFKRLIHYRIQDSPNPIWIKGGKKNDYFEGVIKTFMGRDALNVLLYNISKKSVLLPAYLCKEVENEFIRYGYNIHYYDINKDFSVNIDLIKKTIKDEDIEVFYYVVYFGFFSICNSYALQIKKEIPKIYVIEDRAHYLSNQFEFDKCDAYIFSFRKTLPIVEGGGIATQTKLNFEYTDKILANLLPFAMFGKKLTLGYSDKFSRTKVIKGKKGNKIKPISFLSKGIIQTFNYEKDRKLRRELYKEWVKKLIKANLKPVFEKSNEEDIPMGCPICINNAETTQSRLQKKGYYLKRHWPVKDEIEKVAPNAFELSKNVITLPIYAGINEKDQNKIIKLINKYI